MGTSFKDQLLKAGIVNKKQAKKAKYEKHVSRKKNKGKNVTPEINKTLQEQLAKKKRSRELNQQLNNEKLKLENLAQVRQLIKTNCLNQDDYEEPYCFTVGKTIKKLFVNEEIAKKLNIGQMGIVRLDECFEIVPAKVVKKIARRDPDAIVVLYEPGK
jgi:hypothetical protein